MGEDLIVDVMANYELRYYPPRGIRGAIKLGQRWYDEVACKLITIAMPHRKDAQAHVATIYEDGQVVADGETRVMGFVELSRNYRLVMDRNA